MNVAHGISILVFWHTP